MKLTKIQLKLLQNYEKFHTDSLTVLGIVRTFLLSWLLLLVAAVFLFWATTAVGVSAAGWLFVGLCAGAFLRDLGRIQVLVRIWPALREIIRWDRVRELIQAHDNSA